MMNDVVYFMLDVSNSLKRCDCVFLCDMLTSTKPLCSSLAILMIADDLSLMPCEV